MLSPLDFRNLCTSHFVANGRDLSGVDDRSSVRAYRSALLNASYLVSRSHATAGSIKTNAPPEFIHDIMRKWVETHPVKIENVAKGSPAIKLLEKKMT